MEGGTGGTPDPLAETLRKVSGIAYVLFILSTIPESQQYYCEQAHLCVQHSLSQSTVW